MEPSLYILYPRIPMPYTPVYLYPRPPYTYTPYPRIPTSQTPVYPLPRPIGLGQAWAGL